jgi:hypothetical protein
MRSNPSRRRKSIELPPRRRRDFVLIERMGTRTGGTAMKSLLGHGVTIGISSLLCALEHDRAEQPTSESGCEMRLFVLRSGNEECGSGLPVIALMASPGSVKFAWFRCESPRINSSLARSLLRGHCDARRQARSSASSSTPYGLRFPSTMDPP